MKTPKFQIKIDRNNRCRIYINKKWHKDVVKCVFSADLESILVEIQKYKRDSRGQLIVDEDKLELMTETKIFRIK